MNPNLLPPEQLPQDLDPMGPAYRDAMRNQHDLEGRGLADPLAFEDNLERQEQIINNRLDRTDEFAAQSADHAERAAEQQDAYNASSTQHAANAARRGGRRAARETEAAARDAARAAGAEDSAASHTHRGTTAEGARTQDRADAAALARAFELAGGRPSARRAEELRIAREGRREEDGRTPEERQAFKEYRQQRYERVTRANNLAEFRIYGRKGSTQQDADYVRMAPGPDGRLQPTGERGVDYTTGRTYLNPATGEVITDEATNLGKLGRLRLPAEVARQTAGLVSRGVDPVEAARIARTRGDRYEAGINELLDQGLELAQAEIVQNAREEDEGKQARLTASLITQGTTPEHAAQRAQAMYQKKDRQRIRFIQDNDIWSTGQYRRALDNANPNRPAPPAPGPNPHVAAANAAPANSRESREATQEEMDDMRDYLRTHPLERALHAYNDFDDARNRFAAAAARESAQNGLTRLIPRWLRDRFNGRGGNAVPESLRSASRALLDERVVRGSAPGTAPRNPAEEMYRDIRAQLVGREDANGNRLFSDRAIDQYVHERQVDDAASVIRATADRRLTDVTNSRIPGRPGAMARAAAQRWANNAEGGRARRLLNLAPRHAVVAGAAGAVANLIPYAWIGVAPASAVAAGIFQNRVNRALAAAEVPDGAGGTTTLAQAEGAEGQGILRAEADRRRERYLDTGNGNTTGGIDILRGTVTGLEATTQEQRRRNRTRVLGAAASAGVISMIPPVVRNL